MAAAGPGAAAAAAGGPATEVDERELHFLILHFLSRGPCRQAAGALVAEAAAHGLLPTRTDIFGQEHEMGYAELAAQYSHVPPTLLPRLLGQALQARQGSSRLLQGLDSLLCGGIGSLAAPPPAPAPPAPASLARWLAARRAGGGPAAQAALARRAPQLVTGGLAHAKTIRGHRAPIYCLAFDRSGRFLVSGSDDRTVKIWSMATGALRMACLGHEGEVTDLAVGCDSACVASSSNDATIRVWSLQDASLGFPVSVLLGHAGPISFCAFHPRAPGLLASASLDGTCRLWDAVAGGEALHVLRAGPSFGPAAQQPAPGPPPATRHAQAAAAAAAGEEPGPSAAAAAADEAPAEAAPPENEQLELLVCSWSPDGRSVLAGANDCHCYAWGWAGAGGWAGPPAPAELARLGGHKNDVLLLQFSHGGGAFATGSRDGTVRVWRQPRRRGGGGGAGGAGGQFGWQTELTLAGSISEAQVVEARRRRRPPPSLQVTQLAWTQDDSQVLAALSDHSILAWDARSGEQAARLRGHARPVHVLEAHPQLPSLAMSASYDGQIIVWDLGGGCQLASFSTRDTRPGEGAWPDALPLMEGHWTADGTGVAVSDAAGQLHLYGPGAAAQFARARYDQYVAGEAAMLARDVNGYVLNTAAQQPPHLVFASDTLCDFMGEAYPESYQTAWRAGRLASLALPQAQANANGSAPGGAPPAVFQCPPVLSAAAWAAQEQGGNEGVIQSAIQRALERLQAADLAASRRPPPPAEPEPAAAAPAAQQGPARAAASGSEAEPLGVTTRRGRVGGRARGQPRQGSDSSSGGEDFGDREVIGADPVSRAERLAERTRRREELLEGQRRVRRRRAAPARLGSPGEAPGEARRPRARRRADEDADVSMDDFEDDSDSGSDPEDELDSDLDLGEGPSLRPRRATAHYAGSQQPASREERAARREEARRAGPLTAPRPGAAARVRGRPAKAYAWLQGTRRLPGVYVPQAGDDVVYFWQGHAQYLAVTHDKRGAPWTALDPSAADGAAAGMRAAEPCRVVGLEHRVSEDGRANTLAALRLRGSDPASPLFEREFELEVPPTHEGQADFLTDRARFDAAAARRFAIGDRCKIFYPDDGDGGLWWHGTIEAAEPPPAPDAGPFEAAVWEGYCIVWDRRADEEDGAGASDDALTQHAAWEMFDEDVPAEAAACEGPRLGAAEAESALAAVDACLRRSAIGAVFGPTPEPNERYPDADGRGMLYYNQVVALPTSLLIVQARLQHGFYRGLPGLRADLQLLAGNATAFNGEGSYFARLAQRVADEVLAAVEGRELPPADDLEMELEEEGEGEERQVPAPAPRAPRERLERRRKRRRASSSPPSSLDKGASPRDRRAERAAGGRTLRARGSHRPNYAEMAAEAPAATPPPAGRRSSRLAAQQEQPDAPGSRRRSARGAHHAEPGSSGGDGSGEEGALGWGLARGRRSEQHGRAPRERRQVQRFSPEPHLQRLADRGEREPIRLRLRREHARPERCSPSAEPGSDSEGEGRPAKRSRRAESAAASRPASGGRIRLRLRPLDHGGAARAASGEQAEPVGPLRSASRGARQQPTPERRRGPPAVVAAASGDESKGEGGASGLGLGARRRARPDYRELDADESEPSSNS